MNIWIFNHYATDMYFDGAGRHQSFAKYLKFNGHDAKIFCASTVHNSNINVDTNGKLFIEHTGQDNVPYIFVKTSNYQGNGTQRIRNMVEFYFRLFKVVKSYKKNETPDIILASSVHPLTLVAGIKIAKKMHIPCICEIRDLWPESIVAFTKFTNNNIIIKSLYKLEKWIYREADALIFTMEGGKQYIIDKKWDKEIDLAKVFYINNGIDLDEFDLNVKNSNFEYSIELKKRNLIYAGSLRAANNVMNLVYAAKILKQKKVEDIQIIIFGDGPDKVLMEKYIKENRLDNIILIGKIDKQDIPKALTIENGINCINYKPVDIFKYGGSQNKLFEYLASGRPIIANLRMGYDIIEKNQAGIIASTNDANGLAEAIEEMTNIPDFLYSKMCYNARETARQYDFKILTNKLIDIIKETVAKRGLM